MLVTFGVQIRAMDDAGADDHAMSSTQGGSAPANARDPDGYANGMKQNSGPYALAVAPLHLMDKHLLWGAAFDRFEWADGDSDDVLAYDGQLWLGTSFRRLLLKTEGEKVAGEADENKTQLLYSQAISPYWNARAGVRFDQGEGENEKPDRSWLALGVAGLSPYWFDVEVTAYIGEDNRSALVAEVEYELLLTQRWILQPRIEATLYGSNDDDTGNGSGLSDVSAGLRLRYEISRQFAPYVGAEWIGRFGNSADITQSKGGNVRDTRWLAGVRFWF